MKSDLWIAPHQFNIDAFYRLGENLIPEAVRVLYAISSNIGINGTMVVLKGPKSYRHTLPGEFFVRAFYKNHG